MASKKPAKKNEGSKGKRSIGAQKRRAPEQKSASEPIIRESTKRDIIGVIFILLAIIFMILAIIPATDAVVSDLASSAIHLTLGVGAYILPFVLLGIGITFIYRTEQERIPIRAAIGLSIIYISLLALIALFTPISVLGIPDPSLLFAQESLVNYGGYIGAGLAWCGMTLLGSLISGIIFIGFMIVGVLIIGFSISKMVDRIKRIRFNRSREEKGERSEHGRSSNFYRTHESGNAKIVHRENPALGSGLGVEDYVEPGHTRPLIGADPSSVRRKLGRQGREVPEPNGNAIDRMEPQRQNALIQPTPMLRNLNRNAVPQGMTMPLVDMQLLSSYRDDQQGQIAPDDDARFDRFSDNDLGEHEHEAFDSPEGMHYQQGQILYPPQSMQSYEDDSNEDVDAHEGRTEDEELIALIEEEAPELVDEDSLRIDSHTSNDQFMIGSELLPSDVGINVDSGFNPFEPEDASFALLDLAQVNEEPNSEEAKKGEFKKASVEETIGTPTSLAKEKKPERKRKPARKLGTTSSNGFTLPPMSLLKASKSKGKSKGSDQALEDTAARLQTTLSDFKVNAQVVGWIAGPTVTLYEVDLPSGVRVSKITSLTDDLALALASPGIRIFAPIPGTNYVGIEVPNSERETVLLTDVLEDADDGPLEIAIGKDVEGNSIVSDLAKMPHLLIGGTTGSGKSVSINAMIMSILMRATPEEVRFIMIDPKRVEFSLYNGIPHLYVPVVTEPKEAASALSWAVAEMERRLKLFSKVGARNITQYNDKLLKGEIDPEGEDAQSSQTEQAKKKLPYIVIVIDELADLMMNVGKEVEFSISRIAQLARAAGIHLIVATQRPSTNVVTGLIKANITNRIAFNVASGIDSRVILDTPGAETLIGNGDMLLSKPELAKPQRIQGCYISEDEIEAVVDFVKGQEMPDYHGEILQTNLISIGDSNPMGGSGGDDDPLLWEAADLIVSTNAASTSNVQRRLKVGYARAARIVDQLEEHGVVGPSNGSKPREILVDELELETLKAFEADQ